MPLHEPICASFVLCTQENQAASIARGPLVRFSSLGALDSTNVRCTLQLSTAASHQDALGTTAPLVGPYLEQLDLTSKANVLRDPNSQPLRRATANSPPTVVGCCGIHPALYHPSTDRGPLFHEAVELVGLCGGTQVSATEVQHHDALPLQNQAT